MTSSYQFLSLPPEKPRGALTKIRDLSKDLTKGLRKDLSASSSTIVKPRNSNNLFGDRKPMSSLNGGSHPSINSSTRWLSQPFFQVVSRIFRDNLFLFQVSEPRGNDRHREFSEQNWSRWT